MPKFDLEKETKRAKFVIEKRKIPNVKAQVLMNLDVSGSARGLFSSGQMQEAFQRVLPIGILFDDNSEVDMFTFQSGNSITHIDVNATTANYADYIEKHILRNPKVKLWGGTDYAPVIAENLDSMGFYKKGWLGGKTLKKESASGFPAIVYFFTDGENNDQSETLKLLKDMQDAGVQMYVLFIGIGNANFRFIEQLGDKFDNTGFLNINDLKSMEHDEDLYEKLLPEELCTWLATSKK